MYASNYGWIKMNICNSAASLVVKVEHWASGVGTMGTGGTLYPQVQDLYPLYLPSQRCGLCQNSKQTTLTTRLYSALEVFLNDMRYINPRFTYLLTYCIRFVQICTLPPLTKTFRCACIELTYVGFWARNNRRDFIHREPEKGTTSFMNKSLSPRKRGIMFYRRWFVCLSVCLLPR